MLKRMPWPFEALMAVFFVCLIGGIISKWIEVKVKFSIKEVAEASADVRQYISSAEETRVKACEGAAQILFDFAKVALGALVVSVTQLLQRSSRPADHDADHGAS